MSSALPHTEQGKSGRPINFVFYIAAHIRHSHELPPVRFPVINTLHIPVPPNRSPHTEGTSDLNQLTSGREATFRNIIAGWNLQRRSPRRLIVGPHLNERRKSGIVIIITIMTIADGPRLATVLLQLAHSRGNQPCLNHFCRGVI